MTKNIVLIGSGNVAYHLAKRLVASKYKITLIFSRSIKAAKNLAEETGSRYTNDISKIKTGDLIIIAVKDNVIKSIINKLPDLPVVHTAGSISLEIFKGFNFIYYIRFIRCYFK